VSDLNSTLISGILRVDTDVPEIVSSKSLTSFKLSGPTVKDAVTKAFRAPEAAAAPETTNSTLPPLILVNCGKNFSTWSESWVLSVNLIALTASKSTPCSPLLPVKLAVGIWITFTVSSAEDPNNPA